MSADEGIYRFSTAGGVTNLTRYPNFLTNYGDYGALQRIAYSSLGSNGAIVFSNIPTIYQDLRLVISARDTNSIASGSFGFAIYLKEGTYGYTDTVYSATFLTGDGSSATSARTSASYGGNGRFIPPIVPSDAASGIFGSLSIDILNYANTTTNKTIIYRDATDRNGAGKTELGVGLWRRTDAVTQIGIYTTQGGSQLLQGSTAELFGIKAANS